MWWRRFERVFVRLALKPRKAAAGAIGLFLSAIAIVQGVLFLSQNLGAAFAVLAGAVVIWLILIIFITSIMFDIKVNYNRLTPRSFVYQSHKQKWHFNDDGSRNVGCETTMIFHQDAKPEDFIDTLFGSLGLSFEDMRYKTSDGVVEKTEQPRPDAYNVHWKPSRPIYAGDTYTHSFSYLYPKGESPLEKSITIAAITPCRYLHMAITADRKIERIRVKEDGGETQFWDSEKILEPSGEDYPGYIKNLKNHSFDIEVDRVDLEKRIFVIIEFSADQK